MKTSPKVWLVAISLGLAAICGCTMPQDPAQYLSVNDLRPGPSEDYLADRFTQPQETGPTAVESTIELSRRYAELSDQVAALKQQKQQLLTENTDLRQKVRTLQDRLARAQEELAQANGLLREMVVELNNWKNNVMGFRDEMRGAQQAQLEALLKILKALGAEVPDQAVSTEAGVSQAPAPHQKQNNTVAIEPQQLSANAGTQE